jgi:hypothetical protein
VAPRGLEEDSFMSTINGCGTMFYGWRHSTPQSTATKWFTLLYLPIIPLSRYALKPTTDFTREKFVKSAGQAAAALVGYGSRTDNYLVHGNTPLNWAEVLLTYARAYLLLPVLMLWPFMLVYLMRQLTGTHPEWEEAPWFTPALVGFVGLALINAVVVPMWAIQSARGYKGGPFRRRKD